jgi:nucleoside-diphosphate-sugar epimerase
MKVKNILITGAGGFLGGRTAKYFAEEEPDYHIIATSRRKERMDELTKHGCNYVAGDLSDAKFCDSITQGVDIVVHCAALSAPFGAYQNFYNSNLLATQHLLNAASKNGAVKFIFISTPSIYFNFKDRFDVKESDALPAKMVNAYAQTKLMAEQLVLSENKSQLQTIALRPRAIIGAEDTVIFPRVLEAYRSGRLKIIGNGNNICDLTCARNVIEAIKCAITAPDVASGEAYNITDGESVNFWDAVNYALSSLGYEPVKKRIPKQLAAMAATILEQKARWLSEKKEPPLTKYGVGILHHNFTLNIEKAKSKLGYQPVMSTLEGINEYINWHKNQT